MNDGYLARLKLVEQQITVMRSDMNKALNEVMDTITKMMTAHRMFQIYIDENLRELRDKAGLSGSLLTDGLASTEDTSSMAPSTGDVGGKEL